MQENTSSKKNNTNGGRVLVNKPLCSCQVYKCSMVNMFRMHFPLINLRGAGTRLVISSVEDAVESYASKCSDDEKQYERPFW